MELSPDELKRMRKAMKLSQQALADKCGVHWTTISRIERGQMSPTMDTLNKLVAVLGVQGEDVKVIAPLTRRVQHKGRPVRLVGKVPAGDPRVVDLGDGSCVDIPEEDLPDGEVVGVVISGESMLPNYLPGDIVILRCADWPEVRDGDDCAVTDAMGETTFKRVEFRRSSTGEPEVWLVPYNKATKRYDGRSLYEDRKILPEDFHLEGVACFMKRRIGR